MSKEAQCQNFQNTMLNRHAGLLEHKIALQGPEIRKSFEEVRRKDMICMSKTECN